MEHWEAAGAALLGLALGSGGLAFVGLITGCIFLSVGPSGGHFYADNDFQAWLNMSLRFILSGAAVVGMFFSFVNMIGIAECEVTDKPCGKEYYFHQYFWPGLAIGSIALSIGLAIFDVVTAPRAARRANERWRQEQLKTVLVPTVLSDGQGKGSIGLLLSTSF
jgi:hypothetical protein